LHIARIATMDRRPPPSRSLRDGAGPPRGGEPTAFFAHVPRRARRHPGRLRRIGAGRCRAPAARKEHRRAQASGRLLRVYQRQRLAARIFAMRGHHARGIPQTIRAGTADRSTGTTYHIYYGVRTNLANMPADALTSIRIRLASEVDDQVEQLDIS